MLQIPFEWFEFAFEYFESLSSGLNFDSILSHPFRMVRICILMLRSPFKCFKFGSNASNTFRMVKICIQMFESLSSGSNMVSNASKPL